MKEGDEYEMQRTLLIFSIAALLCMTTLAAPAMAATITVPDDYSSVKDAIYAASPGDTVFIRNGTYMLPTSVNLETPNLHIMGESAESVIIKIDASSGTPTFDLNTGANGTHLEGITFSGISKVTAVSSYNIIENNVFENPTSNLGGLDLESTATFNTVRDNLVTGATGDLAGMTIMGHSHLIENNTIQDSVGGLLIAGANNTVIKNSFINNTNAGIATYSDGFDVENNRIYLNTITGNGAAATTMGTTPPTTVSWVSPEAITYTYNGTSYSGVMGNYWGSNYTGADSDGNGIGDTSFAVPNSLGNDTAPLMEPFGNYFGGGTLSTIDVSPGTADLTVGGTQQFTATGKDALGTPMGGLSFTWSSSNETVGTVNANGLFAAVGAGSTTVTATNGSVSGTASVSVTEHVAPDLIPTAISAGSPTAGNATTVTVTVENAGNGNAGAFNVTLLANGTYSGKAAVPSLKSMYSRDVDIAWTPAMSGPVNLTAVVDAEGAIVESNTTNNALSTTVSVAVQGLSDLRFQALIPNGNHVFAHEPNKITVNIKNTGTADVGAFNVSIVTGDGFNGTIRVEGVAAGSGVSYPLPSIEDPTLRSIGENVTITAVIDPENAIPDSDRSNNEVTVTKSVIGNGYKGKHWTEGDNITTKRVFDLHGNLTYSFGDSAYHSGYEPWTARTVNWTAADLPLPASADIREARLYVPYCWDKDNVMAGNFSLDFNGVPLDYDAHYTDRKGWGGYDIPYGMFTYNVTEQFAENATNVATLHKTVADHQVSTAGLLLAVVYEDPAEPERLIFLNEEFDNLFAHEALYYVSVEEATAFVPFTGATIDLDRVQSADLITVVPWAVGPEGNLIFNGQTWYTVWDHGGSGGTGETSGTQVAVDRRDVSDYLQAASNEAAIQGGPDTQGSTSNLCASNAFLIIEYADDTAAPVANFTANVTAGEAPLAVQFNDTSTGSPTAWTWDFENDGIIDSTEQNATHTYTTAGTYTVNLTVTNADGSDSKVKTDYITVTGGGSGGEAPVAAFTATSLNGLAPLSVTFTDASTNSPTAWSWESRPSGTDDDWTEFSTEQNPTYEFAAGAYDIRLTATNAAGNDTVTETQYISSSAGAKRLATVQNGTVSGDLYVGAYGGFSSGTAYATNTFNQTFTLPAYTDVQWARLYTVVYAAGTDNRAGTATVRFDGDGNGTYNTLGIETLATAADNTASVYPVNDHVNRQYSDYMLWYDVTGLVGSQNPKAEVVATPVAPNFDGRIKEVALVVAYNDGDDDEVRYWVNDGHDYQANGAGGVTSTFATGGLAAGWTDATLQNVMLSSKDALYTFNGAAYTGGTPSGYFGTNTWDVKNNLTAGSDSSFTYVPNGGSYKTTLATLAVKYPQAPSSAPVANFTANVTAGETPLAVQFTDTSTGSPTSWAWDFGDNTTSAEQNPVHTYSTAGTYSVNLTVTNAAGSDTEIKTDYITVTVPSGGDAPDLAVSTLAPNNGEVFSASGNTYTAKITNIGTADAGAFSVEFNVSGTTGTVAVDALAAGTNTTVTWTDETIRNAGDAVTITVTADPDGLIAESNEENNLLAVEKTVVHNGYRGMRWTDGDDIKTAATYDVHGDLLWSAGDSSYLSAGTGWTEYTVQWTADDLAVPANAMIEGARLYVPYTWDKGPVFPYNVSLTFNDDVMVEQDAFYEDEKGWGSSYPYGMAVYDITDAFSADGNTAMLTSTFPGGGNVSVRGMLLAVVYDDGTTAPHTILMNEGFDLLYGGAAQGTTPEQATAYAPFTLDPANAASARLVTVAPGAGPTEGDLLFNDEEWTRVWNYTGTTQIGVDERDVTALLAGENLAGFRSDADWMEAAAAFLVVEYAPEPGSIAVTSTPAGAAVWLDGEDTGKVTPITLENVPVGDHVVTLKLDGYAAASAPVTVVSGETAEVIFELTTLTGDLTVTSTPVGAAIFIDGADTGEVTNTTLDGIAVGEHTVTLRKDGYADAVAVVTIVYNETATLHQDLIEAHGSIAVASTPTGAAIFLDGIETGKLTNALLENVPAGDHVITLKLAGYADASKTVTVADNETATVHFLLTEPAGSIVVTSAPDGARIFFDGIDTGEVTNATLTNVPVGEHTVRVERDGYLDTEETVTVASGKIAAVHFDLARASIALQSGWNFVSTPKRLAGGQDTIAIFDSVETDGRPVLYYNGTCQWEDLSREDAFRPLDGIWIYANGTYEIPLAFAAGSNSPPPTKYLDAGWNTIGFTDTVPEPAVTTLRSVETTWANLWGWKTDEQTYDVSIIRGATGRHGETRELSPFQGYWIYMNDADTLTAIGA
jgi:PKD repeat protein